MSTQILTLAAAVGSGLIAGIFFAFSVFVMQSLSALPARCGIHAMQEINKVIVKTLFIPVFFGTAAICVALLVSGFGDYTTWQGLTLASGSLLYLGGSVLVTIAFNVPRNTKLGSFAADSDAAAQYWTDYRRSWTRWNHVRTVASTAAAIAFTAALLNA